MADADDVADRGGTERDVLQEDQLAGGGHPAHPAQVARTAGRSSAKEQASGGLGIQTTRNFGLNPEYFLVG